MRRSVMLLVIAAGTAGVACSLVFPYDGYGPGTAEVDSGDAGAPDAADAFTPGCPLTRAPERPLADDPGGQDTTLSLAVSKLVLGVGNATTPGLDLDGVCTCPDPAPCIASPRVCDREGGVDNAFDDVLSRFGAFGAAFDQERVQQSVDKGYTTLLMVVHRWNGLPNDTSVEVGLMASLGTTGDGGNQTPRKDGTDEWVVDPAAVANSTPPYVPKTIAMEAYVSGGVLVAHGSFTVVLGSATIVTISLDEGVITGRLVRDGIWRLTEGRLAGRWPTSKLLPAFAAIEDPVAKGSFLCGDSGTYATFKPQFCAAADISATQATDLTGKKCDALSVGMGFEAVEARFGAVGPPRNQVIGCSPDWKDDCPR